MQRDLRAKPGLISRRTMLSATAAAVAASPALAEDCRIGPPPHEKGPRVWMEMDQVELDAAYDQAFYAPLAAADLQAARRQQRAGARAARCADARGLWPDRGREARHLPRQAGRRRRSSCSSMAAPGSAARRRITPTRPSCSSMPARIIIVLDFIAIKEAGGDLRVMADQVRRGVAWAYKNAATLRRRSRPVLHRRPFVGRPSVRRHPGHRLAEGFRIAGRHDQGRPLHERHVRHEAGAAVEAQLVCQVQRRDGAGDELAAPSRPAARARSS